MYPVIIYNFRNWATQYSLRVLSLSIIYKAWEENQPHGTHPIFVFPCFHFCPWNPWNLYDIVQIIKDKIPCFEAGLKKALNGARQTWFYGNWFKSDKKYDKSLKYGYSVIK